MGKYVAGRLLQGVIVLWAAYTCGFALLYALPGDPLLVMLGGGGADVVIDPAQLAALRAQFGFDQPIIVQYFARLAEFAVGDFGISFQTRQPVITVVGPALPQTLLLGACALVLAVVLGTLVALGASRARFVWVRQFLSALPPATVALPSFWVGIVLLQVFSFRLGWFPSLGNQGFGSLVLPAITLALPHAAAIAQVLTRSLENQWGQAYVELARAKGLSARRIQLTHVVRNAVIPSLTMLGVIVGGLFGGTVITETVFSRVGIGRIIQSAVLNRDIPIMLFVVVLSAAIFVVVNLLVDLAYPFIDPRLVQRSGRARRRRDAVASPATVTA